MSSYAPDLDKGLLHRLALAFQELRYVGKHPRRLSRGVPFSLCFPSFPPLYSSSRELNNAGELAYPYSTREIVAIVKHLQAFPDDGLIEAIENVLSFDNWTFATRKMVAKVFRDHGIPVPDKPSSNTITPSVRH